MKFRFRGFDKLGKPLNDIIEARDAKDAADLLQRRGLFASEITPADGSDAAMQGKAAKQRPRKGRRASSGRRLKDLSSFCRQLSILISTGTPLVDAVASLARQVPEGEEWKTVIESLQTRLEEGAQLSDAMAHHPDWFDGVCRSLVAAGEQGGQLDAMMDRLAKLTRQQQKVRASLLGAMVYPCLLIFVAILVLTAMLGFVLPRFEGLFKTLDTPLPPSTKVLMAASHLLRERWYVAAGVLGALGFGIKMWITSSTGRISLHRLSLSAPQMGKVTRSFATARIARVLGVLVEGKVPLIDAIKLTRLASNNSMYHGLLDRAEQAVTRGENISTAFADPALIHPSVCEALRSGERSGRIGTVLLSMADHLDEDNEILVKSAASIIEPLILMVLGVLVGGVAISMFLPLFDLTAAGGGGAP
ncbi:MAG: type II secretion system F family protein [bacterium]|nr:type II secretion system F family protein [bacterium]